jgi:hypothetical protein
MLFQNRTICVSSCNVKYVTGLKAHYLNLAVVSKFVQDNSKQ